MAEVLGGAPAASPKKGGRKPRIIPEVDFSADEFSEFKDAAHELTDAFESTKGTYTKAMADLYSDVEVKTGIPKAIVALLFNEERRDAKVAKKMRNLTKHEKAGLKKVADAFKDTPFGELAAARLAQAEVTEQ